MGETIENYLLHASIVMLKHSATKNTAFTRAPNTSARAHPNVFLDHFFGDICKTKTKQQLNQNDVCVTSVIWFYQEEKKISQLIIITLTDKNDMTSAAISPSM